MEEAARGAAALEASNILVALSAYTQALIAHPNSPDFFTQRAIAFAHHKPPFHALALKDAEYAVLFAEKRAKREKIQAAQHRRVVALYGLGRYADAKFVLSTMEKWRPKGSKPSKMEGDMWMARIESKLNKLPESEKVVTTKEFPEIDIPSDKQIIAQLKAHLNADHSFKFEADPIPQSTDNSAVDEAGNGSNASTSGPTALAPSTATLTTGLVKIRHEWYQNAHSVTLTLYAKGVSKDSAEIDIKDDSIYISFPHPSNPASTFTFSLDPLFGPIDPSESKSAVMSTKIEVTLMKARVGQRWNDLEGTAPLKSSTKENDESNLTNSQPPIPTPAASTSSGPSYPTSSRHGPKNWDKLADDLHAEAKAKPKKSKATKKSSDSKQDDRNSPPTSGDEAAEEVDSDYETGDPVDSFFKKLYAGADDDTRRAMMKSFSESNGTALSTNWAQVGKGPVEEVKSKDDQ